jgi:dienelactone hydrolase
MLAQAPNAAAAVIMVGGAGGGMHGPSGVYPDLARLLQCEGITSLRLDYRHPKHLDACVYDTLAGIDALQQLGAQRVALIGWSFGGAVVITVGAESDAVVGVATVASQTYGTQAVSRLGQRHLLLCHGTADTTLPDRCSRDLYARARGPKELKLFPNGNHGMTNHRTALLETLNVWAQNVVASPGTGRPGSLPSRLSG